MKSVLSLILLLAVPGFFLLTATGNCSPAGSAPDLLFYSRHAPTEFIVVEKKYQKLSIFEHQDQVRLIKEFVCATGQNPGTKKISGDSRTPEGIYFITEIYEDKRITVFGSRAFHLDYPNIFDTHAGHLGDGIFIHGTNKTLIPFSTNGCITLDNRDLDELAPYLRVNTIPIIVVDALAEPLIGKNLQLDAGNPRFAEILTTLSFDLKKIPAEDIQSLSFLRQGEKAVASVKYATYERDQIQYREQVRTYLTRSPVGTWRSIYSIQSQEKNPFLLALRPQKNDLVTRLASPPQPAATAPPGQPEEPVEAAEAVQPAPPDRPGQLAAAQTTVPVETAQAATATASAPAVKPALPADAAKPVPAVAKRAAVDKPRPTKSQELLNFVEKWRSAWAAKDIETYISCYSPSFKNGRLDREGWKQKKMFLNKKYAYINVTIKNVVVQWTPSGANVSFSQTYRSDQYQTTGTKVLQMINKNNRWMIESELM